MITIEQIQKRIAEAIQESGMTQTDLAKRLAIKQQTVSRYFNGNHTPSLDTLANLCKLLDLDANYILCQE